MPDQPLISDLKTGDTLLVYFLATDAAYKTTRNGSEYLELKLPTLQSAPLVASES